MRKALQVSLRSTIFVALLMAVCPSLSFAEKLESLALAPLERLGPEDLVYDSLSPALLDTLKRLPGLKISKLESSCQAGDSKCQEEAAKEKGFELLLRGSVERFVDGYALRLSLLRNGKPENLSRVVKGGAPALKISAQAMACELVAKRGCEGTLQVDGPGESQLMVNGKNLGRLPQKQTLPMGRHVLWVQEGKRSSQERVITISYQSTLGFGAREKGSELVLEQKSETSAPVASAGEKDSKKQDKDASSNPDSSSTTSSKTSHDPSNPSDSNKSGASADGRGAEARDSSTRTKRIEASSSRVHGPPSPAARYVFIAGLATGSALLATGTGFGIAAQVGASDLNRRYHLNELSPDDASAYGQVRSQATAANWCFGIASVALVTSALTWLISPEGVFPPERQASASAAQVPAGVGLASLAGLRSLDADASGGSGTFGSPRVPSSSGSSGSSGSPGPSGVHEWTGAPGSSQDSGSPGTSESPGSSELSDSAPASAVSKLSASRWSKLSLSGIGLVPQENSASLVLSGQF